MINRSNYTFIRRFRNSSSFLTIPHTQRQCMNHRWIPLGHQSRQNSSVPPNWKQNGTPEIIIGTTILVLLGVDHYLQNKQDESRRGLMRQLQTIIREDEIAEKERHQQQQMKTDDDVTDMKSLFTCTVRRLPKYFDGSKCLTGVKVGDQVSILQENVGPGGMYHLCRMDKNLPDQRGTAVTNIGWFPISCLEQQV